jgi:hypothetical protein
MWQESRPCCRPDIDTQSLHCIPPVSMPLFTPKVDKWLLVIIEKLIFSCCGAPVNSWIGMLYVDLCRVGCWCIVSQSFWCMQHWNRWRNGWLSVENLIFCCCGAPGENIVKWACRTLLYARQVGALQARHFAMWNITSTEKAKRYLAERRFIHALIPDTVYCAFTNSRK